MNKWFLTEKLPYSQICSTKVGPSYKNLEAKSHVKSPYFSNLKPNIIKLMWTTGVPGVAVASLAMTELELDPEIVSEMEFVSKVYHKMMLAPNRHVVRRRFFNKLRSTIAARG